MHPHLFQFGRLLLPADGILVALGVTLSLALSLRIARLLFLDTDKIWTLGLLAIATAVAGARLLRILIDWPRYGMHALTMSLAVGRGPGAVAGGAAMAIAAAILYAVRAHLPIRRTADAFAPGLALSRAVAAIGCLEAGCGYGTPTHLPWAIVFTSPLCAPGTPLGIPLHPTQLYDGIAAFAVFGFLLRLLRRPHADGEIMGAGLFLGGLSGFFLAFLRGDSGPAELLMTQTISVAMVLAGGGLWLRRTPSAPVSHVR